MAEERKSLPPKRLFVPITTEEKARKPAQPSVVAPLSTPAKLVVAKKALAKAAPKKRGRPASGKPWEKLGISRSLYFQRQKTAKANSPSAPAAVSPALPVKD